MNCTIAKLLECIEAFRKKNPEVDLNTVGVSIERIEDFYFKNNGWKTTKREQCIYGVPYYDTESIRAFQPSFYINDDGTFELVIEAHY